jgi:hypothetical protein
MLDPQIIANLSEQFCEDVDFVGHSDDSVETSSGPREGSFFKATTESSTGDDAMSARQQPSEAISKQATALLAVRMTLGQLDHFAALASQQLDQQSTLRKGQSGPRYVISFVFHTHL